MCSTTFYAVSVVNASLSSLGITIEPLQVVVKINGASTEVAAEKGSVGGEDGGDVDSSLLAKREGNTSEPLVELCNDSPLLFVVDILLPC